MITSKVEDERSKRSVTGNLFLFLECDYLISLKFSSLRNKESELDKILKIIQKGLESRASECMRQWRSQDPLIVDVGFKVSDITEAFRSSNVIIGPLGEAISESNEFRIFWGKNDVELRRFMDGSVREAVPIYNPRGPAYFIPSILQHLQKVHFSETQLSVSSFNLSAFVPRELQVNSLLKEFKKVYDSLQNLLTNEDIVQTTNLPIRKIRCNSSLFHYGGDLDTYKILSFVKSGNDLVSLSDGACKLKLDSKMSPPLTKSIPIILDITTKRTLSPELFAKLRLAYLIELKKQLECTKNISSVLKNECLYFVYEGFSWQLDVEPPPKRISETKALFSSLNTGSIYEFLYSVSLAFPAWSSTVWLVRKWTSAMALDFAVPELIMDCILAHVFLNPIPNLSSPQTVESSFLRFLDFLSFTDFKKTPLILDKEKTIQEDVFDNFKRKFFQDRSSLPPLCSITPFDENHKLSFHTQKLKEMNLRRLINLARKTLHSLVNEKTYAISYLNFEDWLDKESIGKDDFDVVIKLKPLIIPMAKDFSKSLETKVPSVMPITDYNPLDMYVEELTESYGDIAQFYYSKPNTTLGVKLIKEKAYKPTSKKSKKLLGKRKRENSEVMEPNLEAMIDDIRILGKGIVKDIQINNLSI